jgi:hypothetical protein
MRHSQLAFERLARQIPEVHEAIHCSNGSRIAIQRKTLTAAIDFASRLSLSVTSHSRKAPQGYRMIELPNFCSLHHEVGSR